MKLSVLAKKLNLGEQDLRDLLAEEDLGISPDTDELGVEDVQKIENFLGADTAESYEEMVKQGEERELRKAAKKKKMVSTTGGKGRKDGHVEAQKISGEVEIGEAISVKEFAEKTGIPVAKIIGDLMKNGILATLNQQIDYETAVLIASEYHVVLKRKMSTAGAADLLEGNLKALLAQDDPENLSKRAPIVTVMGHVDHGKTSILDVIRQTKVVEGEHGGITQHIGAYQAELKGQKITFLDTPGHEAFTEMRARGAQVTDIAVLVVAANEGIKPQTIESINHAKDAGVPIVVALNKMDLPDANPDRVKGELAEHGVQPEDWGGDTPIVQVSAIRKQGIDNLLDTILLVAEMLDLKANPNRPAVATVIESNLDAGLGAVATVVVNTGTLHIGDTFVVGDTFGKVKNMLTSTGARLKIAEPSTPVRLAGFNETPRVGDILQVSSNEKIARKRAGEVQGLRIARAEEIGAKGMSQIIAAIKQGKLKELKVILKADTKGSLEAVKKALEDIKNEEVIVRVVHAGVGTVNESDVAMAEAGGGIVLGFHAPSQALATARAESQGIEILNYTVIYKLIDDVKKLLAGLLEPEEVITELGKLEVLAVFLSKRGEMVVGGRVKKGKLVNHGKVRIMRKEEVVGLGEIRSLQKEKEAVPEVADGHDCGLRVATSIKIEVGDFIECYKSEMKIRTI